MSSALESVGVSADLARASRTGGRRTEFPRASDRIPVGDLHASPLCLGAVDHADAVERAFCQGINFFFVSCDLHWPAYRETKAGLRRLLRRRASRRADVCVAVTTYVSHSDFIAAALDELLTDLPELESIDLLVAGGLYEHDALSRVHGLAQLRRAGWCRAIGGSFHDRAAARVVIPSQALDLAYIRYNPAHIGASTDLFPALEPARPPVFGFNSTLGCPTPALWKKLGLGRDVWRPDHADYYRFALGRPEVTGLLFAPKTVRQVDDAIAGLSRGPLSSDEEEHLVALAVRSASSAAERAKPRAGPPTRRARS